MRLRCLAAAGPDGPLENFCASFSGNDRSGLTQIMLQPGLSVWSLPQTPWIVGDDGQSLAVGLVFDAASGHRLARLPARLALETHFVERFWGAYVLFVANGRDGHVVLRDPSGSIPLYHRRSGALDIYASDLALLTGGAAKMKPIEPDTGFLRHWLTFPHLRSQLTGVRGAREILPGTARRATGANGVCTTVWRPWTYTASDRSITDFAEAVDLIRDTVLHVVPRLTIDVGHPVVELSGGLDSSIVAAALANAGCAARAVNFATRTPDGDERLYARAVARQCGFELTELVEEPLSPDFGYVPPMALRPLPNAVLGSLHRGVENHLARAGADLVLDGAGGDNVFCYLASASPALDACRMHGPRAGLAAVADIAQLHDTTFWAVARAARRRARRPIGKWPRNELFLAPGAEAFEPAPHPWLEIPAKAVPGAVERMQSMVGIFHFLADAGPGDITTLHPLLAQPVLEACLRIPSWLWVQGGRDRAVARAAFRPLLPSSVVSRRSKGNLGSSCMRGYMSHRTQLEHLLLDGRLADLGLLDREAIRAYLRREGEPADATYIRLLDLSAAETWLRSFDG